MPMSAEDRIKLLQRAREAKALKKAEMDAQKPTPVKGRPRKKVVKEEPKTLDLVNQVLDEKPVVKEEEIKPVVKEEEIKPVKEEDDEDDEVEEQIVYEKIPKKKKKKIVRKIIRQVESSSDDDVEEQIIYEKPPKKTLQARPHQVERPRPQTPPRQVEVEPRNPFFNY